MALTEITCPCCNKAALLETGAINRARRRNMPIYCGRECAGIMRRVNKTNAQKVDEKRIYDQQYRAERMEIIKAKKKDYYQRTRDPEKEREIRKAKMPRHIEYCRRPEYRKKKKEYDRVHRAKKYYGEFWEAFLLTQDIDAEVNTRMSDYDVRMLNGTLNKKLQRRKDYDRAHRN